MNSASTVSLGVIGLEERTLLGQSGHGWSLGNHYVKQRRGSNAAFVSFKGFGKFKGRARLNLIYALRAGGGLQQQQQQQLRKTPRLAERLEDRAWDASSALHTLQLECVAEMRDSKTKRNSRVRCNVGVAPVEEPKSNAEDHTHEEQHSIISGVPREDFSVHVVSHVPEQVVAQVGGKAGLVSFYPQRSDSSTEDEEQSVTTSTSPSKSNFRSIIWPLGPFILVASVVLPPLYLRKIFGALLEDSLVTGMIYELICHITLAM